MNIKDIVCKFNAEIKRFANRKYEFCNCPGRDFSRNRKQNFPTTHFLIFFKYLMVLLTEIATMMNIVSLR